MKSILMSYQPYWYYRIFIAKDKKIEVRKSNIGAHRNFAYCSKNKKSFNRIKFRNEGEREQMLAVMGKVGGEYVCDKVDKISVHYDTVYSVGNLFANKLKNMCLTVDELKEYLGAKNNGYAIGITDLKTYDKPKELREFSYRCKSMKRCNNCAHYEATPEHEWIAGLCTTMGKKTLSKPPQSYMNVETPDWAKESAYKAARGVTE